MEESSGKPVVSRKSKYFTVVESSYSLHKTPARSDSKPKPEPGLSKILSPEHSNSLNVAKSEAIGTSKSIPSGYPSHVRVSAVQNSPFSSPKTPLKNGNKEEKGGGGGDVSQEPEIQKRVKQTLQDFRGIYDKLIEEAEKEPGGRLRNDLVAYNLLKGKNKDPGSISRCLGVVQGVEIGDKFDFRVELFLIGLHCHLQASIDYLTRDERLVAVSIVSVCSGKYSNVVRISGDVLVCCGSGNEKKDQKMEGGNLALKNSIYEGTPVRVILGLRDGKKITYVYGGLYSVEKYWSKKGNCRCKVFLFQLRRLEGQTKVDIKEVMKSISSSTCSIDIEDKHSSPSKCKGQQISLSICSPVSSEICNISSNHDVVEVINCFGKRGREE